MEFKGEIKYSISTWRFFGAKSRSMAVYRKRFYEIESPALTFRRETDSVISAVICADLMDRFRSNATV